MSVKISIYSSLSGNLPIILTNLKSVHDYECLMVHVSNGKMFFSTELGTFSVDCEVDEGTVFEPININGIDLFNVVESISDDYIFFDSDGQNLIISSYYNDSFGGDEVMVSLKSSYDFIPEASDKSVHATLKSSPSSIMTILPLFYSLDRDIWISSKDGVFELSQDNDNDVTFVYPKENAISNLSFEGNGTFIIRQRDLFAMMSTGSFDDVVINFTTSNALSESNDFVFSPSVTQSLFHKKEIDEDVVSECVFMVDDFKHAIERIVRMIPYNNSGLVNIKRYADAEGVIEISYARNGSEYSVVCAGKIDDDFNMNVSHQMLVNLVKTSNVDAIKIGKTKSKNGLIKFENEYFNCKIEIKDESWLPF